MKVANLLLETKVKLKKKNNVKTQKTNSSTSVVQSTPTVPTASREYQKKMMHQIITRNTKIGADN